MRNQTQYEVIGGAGRIHVSQVAPADPVRIVLLVHGFGEHAGRYGHVIDRLVADGAIVHAPDHRGHGRSEGARAIVDVEALVDDLQLVVSGAAAQDPGLPVAMVGHSMGGLISIRYAQRRDGLSALALSGPFLGNPAFASLLQLDEIPIGVDPAALSRDPAVGVAYSADPLVFHGALPKRSLRDMLTAVDRVADGPELSLPVLWLHGGSDPLADYGTAKAVAEKVLGSDLTHKIYPGAAHEVFHEINKDEVLDDLSTFLGKVV